MDKYFEVKSAISYLNLLRESIDRSEEYLNINYYEFIHAIIYGEPNKLVRQDLAQELGLQINRIYPDLKSTKSPKQILKIITCQASNFAYAKLDMDMLTKRSFEDEIELFSIARAAILLERTIMRYFSYEDEEEQMPDDDPRHPLSY
tara:strand:+ start:1363 stop:1803 length:441 start_codon:yes stop_codon:yes gene_type:complete